MGSELGPGVISAGDVEFKELSLIDTKNKDLRYNLLGAFVDFTIYEDLFSPVLTGYVALVESQNLIESIPIVGEELIYAEFATPSLPAIKCYFQITKIGIREHDDKTSSYTLELISREGYVDLNSRKSKSYSGNTSVLLNSVYNDAFGKKILESDSSNNNIKFVSPYWGPLKTLNYITSRALYPNNKIILPNYMFYQTCGGHKFKSLSNLLAQKPVMNYFFDKNKARISLDDGTSVRDINREYSSVKELTFVAAPDFIKNMINGAYNHNVFTIDLFNKSYSTKNYSYTTDFANSPHTDSYKLTTFNPSVNSGLFSINASCNYLFDGVTNSNADIISKRTALLAQLETWKLGIVVPCRTDLSVGMIVNFMLNQFKTVDSTDKFNPVTYDKIYSGKYLITAIQFRFTQVKSWINMEIVKDSAFSEIKIQ